MYAFFHQKVNSYLCIALVSLMGFWTCLYYLTHATEAVGANLVANYSITSLK